jgi:hypothetical protein
LYFSKKIYSKGSARERKKIIKHNSCESKTRKGYLIVVKMERGRPKGSRGRGRPKGKGRGRKPRNVVSDEEEVETSAQISEISEDPVKSKSQSEDEPEIKVAKQSPIHEPGDVNIQPPSLGVAETIREVNKSHFVYSKSFHKQ